MIMTYSAVTIQNVFDAITSILAIVWDTFTSVISTITGNPLLYVPVILGLGVSIILGVVKLVRRMGVKGMGAGRRRRRR